MRSALLIMSLLFAGLIPGFGFFVRMARMHTFGMGISPLGLLVLWGLPAAILLVVGASHLVLIRRYRHLRREIFS